MMRILHVITSLEIGGAEKLMVDLLPRLNTEENQVDLLVFNGIRTIFTEQIEAKGIKVYSLSNSRKVYNPLNVFRLIHYLKCYDIIHSHNTACQLFVPIAKTLSFAKCKLFTTEHNTTNRRRGNVLYKIIDLWMYRRYKKIVCVSDSVEANLKTHLHSATLNSRILTIANGIDRSRFYNASPSNEIRSLAIGQKIILMVARFDPQKNQAALIRALTLLPSDTSLFFVGKGELQSECVRLSKQLNVIERVHFLGVRNDIPELMKSADVIVLSSHYEGLSLSSLEAMASGRPFIASDVPGLREIVKDAGLLFPDDDSAKLAEILNKVLSDKSIYLSVANRCIEKSKKYDISNTCYSYFELYQLI